MRKMKWARDDDWDDFLPPHTSVVEVDFYPRDNSGPALVCISFNLIDENACEEAVVLDDVLPRRKSTQKNAYRLSAALLGALYEE